MTSTAQKIMSSLTDTAKVADLRTNTITADRTTFLTTDHGVPVADTDNWLVQEYYDFTTL